MKQEILDKLVGNIEQEVAHKLKGKMDAFQEEMYIYFNKNGVPYFREIFIVPGDVPRTLKQIVTELSRLMFEQAKKDAIGEACEALLNKAETKRSKEISEMVDLLFENRDINIVTTGSLMDGFDTDKPEPQSYVKISVMEYAELKAAAKDYAFHIQQVNRGKAGMDYPESLVELDGETVQKLDEIRDKQE